MTGAIPGPTSTPISCGPAAIDSHMQFGPDTASSTARSGMRAATAHSVIERVFTISMSLAACAEMIDGVAATRVMSAIDGLDQVISELRSVAFDRSESHPVTGEEPDEPHGGV